MAATARSTLALIAAAPCTPPAARLARVGVGASAMLAALARRNQSTSTPAPPADDDQLSVQPPTPTRQAPTVRMLAEAGLVVNPIRTQTRRRRNAGKKPVTQKLLAQMEAQHIIPTQPASPLADTVFNALYRRCRARLWVPTPSDARLPQDTDMQAWLDTQLDAYVDSLSSEPEKLAAFEALSSEEQLDFALLPTWQALDESEQREAHIRVRFEAARKLGWRRGFSSGFPYLTQDALPEGGEDAEMLAQLQLPALSSEADSTVRALLKRVHTAKNTADVLAAHRELFKLDEARAWASWQAMPEPARLAEQQDVWTNRDRSRIYIDNTPGSSVCLKTMPRWFNTPQRAGPLNFLPNILVRLVRNYTASGEKYDVWKATFRVPLSMHKHALRSYLLAIYGLRTTWARSMIYRSKLTRSARGGGVKRPGKDRTYKKVEVGLLEPFLWPGVNPSFLPNRMLVHEMRFEAQRAYMKMTRTARWRARRTADPLLDALTEGVQHGVLDGAAAVEMGKVRPRVMAKGNGIPTAKHGRILAMLLERKREREGEIRKIVEERAGASSQQASTS
ncbi:unnamed protein product [Tilletia laevis]|nr:hypothetical protein CF336_g6262 [Tilletia laevis]KAE8190293.1 hypothetical protein CF328_g6018 [Tilletia controversa]KAE8255202.1 hypothetical protein A4X03_0g5598 [Tilletia caries]KAE8190981.1 hypothetical protein CF335_g6207 [Tilletia laevis]CAD6911032.1 unnamed protein product [Tilletia controversa]